MLNASDITPNTLNLQIEKLRYAQGYTTSKYYC